MPSLRDTPSRAASSTGTPQRSNGSTSTPGARPPSRSTSRTPQPALHHRSADEIALKEAQRILGTPTNRILRDADPVFTSGGSARDLRHRKLLEARHEQELEQDDARSQMTEATAREVTAGEDDGTDAETSKGPDEDSEDMEPDIPSRSNGRRTSSNVDNGDAPLTSTSVTTADSVTLPDQSEDETPIVDLEQAGSDDTSSESESESSDSESDSDSDPTSDEDSDAEEERLEQLLSKAKLNATQQAPTTSKGNQPEAQSGEVVLQFDETDKERKEAPIPDLTIPKLPKAHITFTNDGSARASSSGTALLPAKSAGSSSRRATPSLKGKEKAVELEPDNIPYEREMSKREKAHQPRKATASELWTQMPKARSDVLPQMKRDYQALALANSLDPKRFMKGSTKLNKVPETFAIGRIIDQPKHLQDTTLARDQRYRPGQIVQDIVRDEGVGSTAKRKYGDLQYKRMENGRGKGWQKRTKW